VNAQAQIEPSIVASLAKALAEIEGVQKNKQNPHLKNKYADLSAVIEAIQPIATHGLWYRQVSKRDAEGALVETFYIHESGSELSAGETFVPANKKDPQGFGSALTYCRRYALQTAFGLAPDDDDGEAATKSYRNARQSQEAAPEQSRGSARQSGERDGGNGTINAAQLSKLKIMIDAIKLSEDEWLRKFGAPRGAQLHQFPEAQFRKAVDDLEDRLAQDARQGSNRSAQGAEGFGELEESEVPF
jgi:hypothetical protein